MKLNQKRIHGTIQTEYWQRERWFALNEISFAEEIVVDKNTLNFYVPIFFDVAAVFGKPVEKLGPDDSLNVYTYYDMEAGVVSEYLKILIKHWDGVEDAAMYHL